MIGSDETARRTGVWLHAVTCGAGDADVSGVGGTPVRAVRAADLTAVVSTVDLTEFGEQPLARNLENLAWLEATAHAHHRVVEAVGRNGPVIPTRLATIYRDDRSVADLLAERRAEFGAALGRVAGRIEWGVKAYACAETPVDPGTEPGARDAGPGMRYLRQRRAQLSGREQARRAVVEDAETIHRALVGSAEADRRHPPQAPGLSGRRDWMVLNGTYLVSARSGTRFADAVAALADRYPHIELELTGPWPPYSFAALDEEAGA